MIIFRFSKLTDFDAWKQRLKTCQLDLQDMTSIDQFLFYIKKTIPHLDILINNAAQTIYRPQQYYQSLITNEQNDFKTLTKDVSSVLVDKTQTYLSKSMYGSNTMHHGSNNSCFNSDITDREFNRLNHVSNYKTYPQSILQCPESNVPEFNVPKSNVPDIVGSNEFPKDQKDEHGEQVDLRMHNSWTYNLDEVPLQELLQVR